METLQLLSRSEMRNIKGGGCRVAFRDSEGNWGGYSSGCFTYEQAQSLMQFEYEDGSYASGYCCASCGNSDAGFGNAYPC